jgi:stalled ribosome rescue protein Dom34
MAKKIGLWIDHKRAVLVILDKQGERIWQIESGLKKRVRYRGAPRPKTPYSAQYKQGDDQLDKQFMQHLNQYYKKVVAQVRGAESILVFGPGEAKFELEKYITHAKGGIRNVRVEKADKMTDRQIAAKVRKYFQEMGAGA